MNEVHVYSFQNIICALGTHMPKGFATDNSISITALGDGVTDEAGADGEVVMNVPNDSRYEVKLAMKYGSKTNAWLLNQYLRNQRSPGSGIFPILIKDLGGNDKFSASQAWVSKPADYAYGIKSGDQTWTIHCVGEMQAG